MAIAAVGDVPRALVRELVGAIGEPFGYAGVALPAQGRPEYAFNKDRRQYHSEAILRRLAQLAPAGQGSPVLGVTDVDLFLPDVPYVIGEADRSAGSAVVSIFRLAHGTDGHPADAERLLRRARVESMHQLGQLLGLSVCLDAHCPMSATHKPSDSDRKAPQLCAGCRGALQGARGGRGAGLSA